MGVFSLLDSSFRRACFLGSVVLLLSGCPWDDGNGGGAATLEPPPPPPPVLSDDAALAALSVAPGVLSPAFGPEVTAYTVSVDNAVASVDVVASPRDGEATLRLAGEALVPGAPGRAVELAVGINILGLEVTAEDGTTKRLYTVEVTREAPPPPPPVLGTDAALGSLLIDPATLSPAFDAATTAYTATVDDSVASITVVAVPRDAEATMQLGGDVLAPGAPGRSVALEIGINIFELEVTAEDGTTTQLYTVEVTREAPPSPASVTLALLVLDADGAPLPGVTASSDTLPAAVQTDAEGRAELPLLAIQGALLRLSGPGLVDQLRRLDVPSSVDPATPLRIGMVRRAAAQRFAADAPVTLTGADGARVELPANAFVDSAGNAVSGEIEAFITPLDVATEAGLAAFPGGYEARGPGGAEGSLITLGVADFSFEQGGERLQLAPGVVATIEVPIYVTENAGGSALQANDPIPLWSLAEADATWDYEGDGQVVASAGSPTGLALRGAATHFSWWNADLFVGREGFGSPGGIFESLLLPKLSCDEPGNSCAPVLPGQQGAWVQASILGRNGPLRSTSRWVPFADDEEVEPIVIPTGFDIGLAASVSDGYYAVASIDPSPVRTEVAGELIEAEVLLKPRHLVDGGLFVPGERLRGYMAEVGEVHTYRFEGRAGRVFRLRGYPAASVIAGPGITADLGATVRVFSGETPLAEAVFDATTVAEIDLTLPADGEFRVTFTADGKVPNFYVATTALLFPQARAAGAVAFPAGSQALGKGLYTLDGDAETYVRLSPAGNPGTCLGPTLNFSDPCRSLDINPATFGRGDNYAPGWLPGFSRGIGPGRIAYLSDHDRPGFSDLFYVDLSAPELATRLSGAEIAGADGLRVIDFRHTRARPERLVYKVTDGTGASTGTPGLLYVVATDAPEASRRPIALPADAAVTRFELSSSGRHLAFLLDAPVSSANAGDLLITDLDTPGASPVRVDTGLDMAAGDRVSSFSFSPDGRWLSFSIVRGQDGTRQVRLIDVESPGVAVPVSSDVHTRAMEARYAPDGRTLVYRNAGSSSSLQGGGFLYAVDLVDPLTPGPAVQIGPQGVRNSEAWLFSPDGEWVLEVALTQVYGVRPSAPSERVELVRLPSGEFFSGEPVFTANGQGLLLMTAASNQPRALIYQALGNPPDQYRVLVDRAELAVGSRGVFQMGLSVDGNQAYAAVSLDNFTQTILAVRLDDDTAVPSQLVPSGEFPTLFLQMTESYPWYQFLPLER